MKSMSSRLLLAVIGTLSAAASSAASPTAIITGKSNNAQHAVIADFGASRGVWIWRTNLNWRQLHTSAPESMVTGDLDGNGQDEIILDFGSTYGVWTSYDNSSWVQLHRLTPEAMVTGDLNGEGHEDVIFAFGGTYGLWVWLDNGSWIQLHNATPEAMVTGDLDGNHQDDLIADFGSPYGLWVLFNNINWVQLHRTTAKTMVTGDLDGNNQDEAVVDFGSPYGVWVWLNGSWAQLHGMTAKAMVTADLDGNAMDEVIIDFGYPYGMWVRSTTQWMQLHSLTSDAIAAGDVDGNGQQDVILDLGYRYGIWVLVNNAAWVPIAQIPTGCSSSVVRISGRQLMVSRRNPDGTSTAEVPYVMRGVFWSPASENTNTSPTDPNNANVRRSEFGKWSSVDIPLMAAMNVNTVRLPMDLGFDQTLGPIGMRVLDELCRHNIMAIMTVDDAVNDRARLEGSVNFYKSHPALLLWSLGSEWNINRYFGRYSTVDQAAMRTEEAAAHVKRLDTNHPVATSYGDIDANLARFVNNVVPSVDLWSLNVYRGSSFDNAANVSVFDQWIAISTKPMFIGEFGIDAFHGRCLSNPPTGSINETEQARWNVDLWNDIARNLSASHSGKATLGGTVFEWNDEWWKVAPPLSQQTSGWTSDGFPDWHASEEYFGIVDIRRVPREVYRALARVFGLGYVPPPHVITFRAISRGANMCGAQANFRRDGWTFFQRFGGGGGGRGFNIATVDPVSGQIVDPGLNFDTWGRGSAAKGELINYIAAIPAGRLVMLAVADEAGITTTGACTLLTDSATVSLVQAIRGLGSTLIQNYCWRGSWAMVGIKGAGAPLAEDNQRSEEARAEVPIEIPEP